MVHDYIARLILRNEVAPNIYHLRFELSKHELFPFIPGQYLLLSINNQYRQFSIVSYKEKERRFDLVIEYFKGGLASEYLTHLHIGDTALFKGPAGVFIQKPVSNPVVYLSTGTGIAPILAMIESTLQEDVKHNVSLFWGLPSQNDIYFIEKLNALKDTYAHFHFTICLSREKNAVIAPLYVGHIQDCVLTLTINPFIKCDVYICGGKESVESLKQFALSQGVDKQHLYFERFN